MFVAYMTNIIPFFHLLYLECKLEIAMGIGKSSRDKVSRYVRCRYQSKEISISHRRNKQLSFSGLSERAIRSIESSAKNQFWLHSSRLPLA